MRDKVKFKEYLGKEKHYPNYLAFFQQELDTKGTGDVLKEYVFAGDERAEDMLCRVFGGELDVLNCCTILWDIDFSIAQG